MNVKLNAQSFYKSPILKKGLKFASNNSSLFIAGASLAMSTCIRPLSILATPKSDRENKKLACAKSISSSLIGYGLMLGASLPVARGVKRIDQRPAKYLKESTIEALKENGKRLQDSKAYQLATQTFKLGLGLVIAVPKAFMTSALIPHVMKEVFPPNQKQQQIQNAKEISFKGSLPAGMGKVLDTPQVQIFSNRFKNSNFVMHTMAVTDTLATWAFVHQTNKSTKIDEKRKKILNNNAIISTGLCIGSGYIVDKALDKPTEKFIKSFTNANKNDINLGKYIEGIRIVKPALILGTLYYGIIPMVSTFLAERVQKNRQSHD